jgi:hypothetical protein
LVTQVEFYDAQILKLAKGDETTHSREQRELQEVPPSEEAHNHPSAGKQQQQSARDDEPVVENRDIANRLRERFQFVQLTRAQVGHPHADEAAPIRTAPRIWKNFNKP